LIKKTVQANETEKQHSSSTVCLWWCSHDVLIILKRALISLKYSWNKQRFCQNSIYYLPFFSIMFEPKNNETKTFVFVKQSIYIV